MVMEKQVDATPGKFVSIRGHQTLYAVCKLSKTLNYICECKEDIATIDGQFINGLCNVALFTDGECNPENNNAECGFDGGDCVFVQSNLRSLIHTFSYPFKPLFFAKHIVSTQKNTRTTCVTMQTIWRSVDLMEKIVV